MGVTTLGVRLGENMDGSDYPGSETRREHGWE